MRTLTFAQAQSRYDATLPPDVDERTPAPWHFADALDQLVDDTERLVEWLGESPLNDVAKLLQLYHRHGLPRCDKSERDDTLIDQYTEALDGLLVAYRDALGDTLRDAADAAMKAEIERGLVDAAEARMDDWS